MGFSSARVTNETYRLDIGTVIYGELHDRYGISIRDENISFGVNTAGLALGCIFLVPIAINYGRRIVYITTTAVILASVIWSAKMRTAWELIVTNLIQGLAGAASEVLVQMTIKDTFFIHQRARTNAFYVAMVATGTFLAPVIAGYIADAQDWPWIWWWSTILVGLNLIAFVFFYEDTKFVNLRRLQAQQ
jgi:MFS family permease